AAARASLLVRAGSGLVRAPPVVAETRVRRRPFRGGALRLAARARGRPPQAGAVDGARRVRGQPRDGAALHDEPVRGRGSGGPLRHASAARGTCPPPTCARPRMAGEVTRCLTLGTDGVWALAATRSRSCTARKPAST